MSAYDVFLDGLAPLIARDAALWDHTQLLSGYANAILMFFLQGALTVDEFIEIDAMLDEMRFGFEPATIESMEEAA